MKLQGKISHWQQTKGFGFVEPNGGGDKAFVHIKAFSYRTRRPVDGDIIVYELVLDKKKGYQAANIQFVEDYKKSPDRGQPKKMKNVGIAVGLMICFGLGLAILIGKLPLAIGVLYLLMSGVTYVAYAIDKSAAKNNRRRTRESTLHSLALFGGWPGALLAQKILRHKSSKAQFQTVFWVTVLLNLAGLIGWFSNLDVGV